MTDAFQFYCKIYKKPRGNWRPRVDIQIHIRASEFPWRPQLQPLSILGGKEGYQPLPALFNELKFGVYYTDQYPNGHWEYKWGIWINSEIHDSPKRGDESWKSCKWGTVNFNLNNGEKISLKFSYLQLWERQFLDEDIDVNDYFYLCWRPGARPDYSDISKQLSNLPNIIEEMLRDGLDSGESEEIIITKESLVKQKIKEKSQKTEIKRKIRVE
ncbi:hypothetical protein DRO97_10150 [Archaeoglobales archaeon]|nr:MAG: hypothetical protein DRO97_10150 [Archaeoglobales archaeon]